MLAVQVFVLQVLQRGAVALGQVTFHVVKFFPTEVADRVSHLITSVGPQRCLDGSQIEIRLISV